MIQLYIIGVLGVLLAAVIGGGKLYVDELQAEKATMTQAYGIAAQTAIDNKKQLDDELLEHHRVDLLLGDRESQLRDLEASNALLNTAMDNLKRNNEDVRKWADAAVPGPVLELLRTGPGVAGQDGSAKAVPAEQPAARSRDPGN